MMDLKKFIVELDRKGIKLYLDEGKLKSRAKSDLITLEIGEKIKANRNEIIALLAENENAQKNKETLSSQGQTQGPLSYSQERLWLTDQVQKGSSEYHQKAMFEVIQQLNLELVNQAINTLIERHWVLRTVYKLDNEVPRQNVQSSWNFKVEVLANKGNTSLDEQASTWFETPFDLSSNLMLRAAYVEQEGVGARLLLCVHHIASDAWSMDILSKEFIEIYQGLNNNEQLILPPLELQYIDYAIWQNQESYLDKLEAEKRYWHQQLADLPQVHSFPLDHARQKIKTNKLAKKVVGSLPRHVFNALDSIAKAHEMTLFMLIHGMFALVISRYSFSTDIVIGTAAASRPSESLSNLVGCFINTLALRVNTHYDQLSDYLTHVRQTHLEAQGHQFLPFDLLVELINPERQAAINPICQLFINYASDINSGNTGSGNFDDISLRPIPEDSTYARFDIELNIIRELEIVHFNWSYDSDILKSATIEKLNGHLIQLLTHLTDKWSDCLARQKKNESVSFQFPSLQLTELQMLSTRERHYLTHEMNQSHHFYSQELCIQTAFEQRVEQQPDSIALVFKGQELTYAELNARANQIAHYLIEHHCINSNTLVGVCAKRSFEFITAILAILKAGGAYVPLDTQYPTQRMEYILSDAKVGLILCDHSGMKASSGLQSQFVNIEGVGRNKKLTNKFTQYSTQNPAGIKTSPSDLAYVMYTSGSTGKPKGVMVPHIGVSRLVLGQDFMKLDSDIVMLQAASIIFDVLTLEVWGTLLNGAKLILYGYSELTVAKINKTISKYKINTLWLTAGFFREWAQEIEGADSLQQLIVGGDVVDNSAIKKTQSQLPNTVIINGYGPTENTVFTATYNVNQPHVLDFVPIGKRLSTDHLYLLNHAKELVPFGCIGEIYVGGHGLAKGYINQEELTSKAFIDNPYYDVFQEGCSKKLYATGDLASYLPDGNLAFHGRTDGQIKVRGYRVELGEIEAKLQQFEEIDSCIIVVKEISSIKQLVGYVCLSESVNPNFSEAIFVKELKQRLMEHLPEYMIPIGFVVIKTWPLTASGKIDRRALPELNRANLQDTYQTPITEWEKLLVSLWAELLELNFDSISTSSNFFELGGNSLLLVRLMNKLDKQSIKYHSQNLLNAATLAEVAHSLELAQERVDNLDQTVNVMTNEDLKCISTQLIKQGQTYSHISPVTAAQQGMIYNHGLDAVNDPYITSFLYRLANEHKKDELVRFICTLVERHELLRSRFVWKGIAAPVQLVMPSCDIDVLKITSPTAVVEQDMLDLVQNERHFFDIEIAPLFKLYESAADTNGNYYIAIVAHHLILDHQSMWVLNREIELLQQGQSIPPLKRIEKKFFRPELSRVSAYFTEYFVGLEQATWPYGISKNKLKSAKCVDTRFELQPQQVTQIKKVSASHGTTPAAFFHLAWAMVVAATSGTDDVLMGTVLSGRHSSGGALEDQMAMLINTLPLRINLTGLTSVDALKQTQQGLIRLLEFEQVPLAEALDCIAEEGAREFISALINYRHNQYEKKSHRGDVELIYAQERTEYPFVLSVNDDQVGFSCDLQIIDRINSRRVLSLFNLAISKLLISLSQEDNKLISQCYLLENTDLQAQADLIHGEIVDLKYSGRFESHFSDVAQQFRDEIAVTCGLESMTYGQLEIEANRLAYALRHQKNWELGCRVAICLSPTIDMLVAALGILKAGGVYVPVDPELSHDAIARLIQDGDIQNFVTHSRSAVMALDLSHCQFICVDDHIYTSKFVETLALGLDQDTDAYLLFTSGSTGKPKGVCVTHANLMNYLGHVCEQYFNESLQGAVVCTSFNFDATITSLFGPLLLGKTVCILEKEAGIEGLKNTLLNSRGSWLFKLTPSQLSAANYIASTETNDNASHVLVIGGESLEYGCVYSWIKRLPKTRFINEYGPTEATVGCAWYEINNNEVLNNKANVGGGDTIEVPIGKGIQNTQLYILDHQQRVCPHGVVGELYIGGQGVARGYDNALELTKKSFVVRALNFTEGSESCDVKVRLYRTGDRVCLNSQGDLIYLGRSDNQVKLRGYRIELSAIGHTLEKIEGIDSTHLCVHNEELIAFLCLSTELTKDKLSVDGIYEKAQAAILGRFPSYMLPSRYIQISSWPLSKNGKRDHQQLLELIGEKRSINNNFDNTPLSEVESHLAIIWANVLEVNKSVVSRHSSFFELGGHSIKLMKLAYQIERELSVRVPFAELIAYVKLSQQASLVEAKLSGEQPKEVCANITYEVIRKTDKFALNVASYAQQSVWLRERLEQDKGLYNIPINLQIDNGWDLEIVEQTIQQLIVRHEVLRTRFFLDEEQRLMQQVCEQSCIKLEHIEVLIDGDTVESVVERFIAKPFDLDAGNLLRAQYVRKDEYNGILTLVLHHIASDRWSAEILQKEFVEIYQSIKRGQAIRVVDTSVTYGEYANWQRAKFSRQDNALQEWKLYYEGAPELHSFPLDFARPASPSYHGKLSQQRLSRALSEEVAASAKYLNVTPFVLLYSAYSIFVSLFSNERDLIIGVPVSGRNHPDLESLVGMFVNTIALRTQIDFQSSFEHHVAKTQCNWISRYAKSDTPFDWLVSKLDINRSLNYAPLFQLLFDYSAVADRVELDGELKVVEQAPSNYIAKYDLELTCVETDSGLRLDWLYAAELFNGESICVLQSQFRRLLTSLLNNLALPLGQSIEKMSDEIEQAFVTHNKLILQEEVAKHVLEQLDAVVESQPDTVATLSKGQTLTFAELMVKVEQLSACLLKRGVFPDTTVALYMRPCPETLIAIFACFNLGANYLPVEPSTAQDRLQNIFDDAKCKLCLYAGSVPEQIEIETLDLSAIIWQSHAGKYAVQTSKRDVSLESAAYVIYTSGTTGQPKGAQISHANLSRYLAHTTGHYLDEVSCSVVSSSLGFDATVTSLYSALLKGKPTLFIDSLETIDELGQLLRQATEPMMFKLTPSHLQALSHVIYEPSELPHRFVVGGEPLTNMTLLSWMKLFPQSDIVNEYGPTETTVGCVTHRFSAEHATSSAKHTNLLPIGKAMVGVDALVLIPETSTLAPSGVAGELVIGGVQVGMGYLNKPELSAQKFVIDIHRLLPGRAYKTGDLVRWNSKGELEFLGRTDNQVKVRGHRVELGEVTHAILKCHSVYQAETLLVNQSIRAYVNGPDIALDELQKQVAGLLPDYMRPSFIIEVKDWPLTQNGKVDIKALKRIEPQQNVCRYPQQMTVSQIALCQIWEQVLGQKQIDINQNFFTLGGHSLLAAKMLGLIRDTFSVDISLRAIFTHSSIRELSAYISILQEAGEHKLGHIPPCPLLEEYPLSFSQKRLWFIDNLEKTTQNYHVPITLTLTGKLDFNALEASFIYLFERHEILRTRYKSKTNGNLIQVVGSAEQFELRLIDLSEYEPEVQASQLAQAMVVQNYRKFELGEELMLRAALIRIGETEHTLLMTVHHIALDEQSSSQLLQELLQCYQAFVNKQSLQLSPVVRQYRDFAHWQLSVLDDQTLQGMFDYWLDKLDSAPKLHSLPLDRPRPVVQSYKGNVYRGFVPKEYSERLCYLAMQQGTSLFSTLQTVFSIFLSRLSGQEDIVMGTPVSQRNHTELQNTLGLFLNSLVLREQIKGQQSFISQLKSNAKSILSAIENQDLPFEMLVEKLVTTREMSHSPVFQIHFQMEYENNQLDIDELYNKTGLKASLSAVTQLPVKFELALNLLVTEQGIQTCWQYKTDLYDEATISRWDSYFVRLIQSVVADPQAQVQQLNMLSEEEIKRQHSDFNTGFEVNLAGKMGLYHGFCNQAKRCPDAIALVGENESLSYGDLKERVESLATRIKVAGHTSREIMGICIPKSEAAIIAILASLAAGHAYVFIDPDLPTVRKAFILQDANISFVLTKGCSDDLQMLSTKHTLTLIDIDELCPGTTQFTLSAVKSNDLAYVIYTSGTTGKPKGVMVEHGAALTHLLATWQHYGLDDYERFMMFSSLSFDASIEQLFLPLLHGKTCFLFDAINDHLFDFIERCQIQYVHVTPSYMEASLKDGIAFDYNGGKETQTQIELLNLGGEKLSLTTYQECVNRQIAKRIINSYGPTECVVSSHVDFLASVPLNANSAPIGNVFGARVNYVLDEHLQLLPEGVVGELYIGGCLASGYLNNEALTKEKFINNPFGQSASDLLYKTGDKVRWLDDGRLEFIGRCDRQIKFRGYRIELNEIAKVAEQIDFVRDTHLYLDAEKDQLTLFFTTEPKTQRHDSTKTKDIGNKIRKSLQQILPEYMVPNRYDWVAEMPINRNGKIDELVLLKGNEVSQSNALPETELQQQLLVLWQRILQNNDLSVDANFFDIGGHSLLAMKLVALVNQTVSVRITLRTLFNAPTIRKLSEQIEKQTNSQEKSTVTFEV